MDKFSAKSHNKFEWRGSDGGMGRHAFAGELVKLHTLI